MVLKTRDRPDLNRTSMKIYLVKNDVERPLLCESSITIKGHKRNSPRPVHKLKFKKKKKKKKKKKTELRKYPTVVKCDIPRNQQISVKVDEHSRHPLNSLEYRGAPRRVRSHEHTISGHNLEHE
jgi:hypothetical protein